MANGHQITFRVDDDLYRKLLEEGAAHGTSAHIMAKEVVAARYGGSGRGAASELGAHFSRQYIARMHEMLRAIAPEIRELIDKAAHEVVNDRAWAGPGQGGRPEGSPRPRRGR